MQPNNNARTQIEGLATLLVLDEEIRKLDTIREFGFFSTNETHRLISYHTAYLWQIKELIGPHLVTQSGTAEIDVHAPINQWIVNKIKELSSSMSAKEIQQINYQELEEKNPKGSHVPWPDYQPPCLLWCPLLNKSEQLNGGLIFFREVPFSESEIKMLRWLIASYQYTWLRLVKPQKIPLLSQLKKKPYLITLVIVILSIMFFPIRLSVLGDGTVVPQDPALINSPMQGVIKSFVVTPGQKVKAGQLLLNIDETDLQAAAEVSKRDLLLTEAKLRTAIQEGFTNKESRAEIPIIQAQLAIDKAHLEYANQLLSKTSVVSPIAGIVIFEGKEDWIGQPVQTGERILVVANPNQVKLKITLPVTNAIKLIPGDHGDFFLYGQLNALSVHITELGYNAKLMPNKVLAYQLFAAFDRADDIPELGVQGTVKIYGKRVPLIYYLLRRPLQALRQTLGI